MKTVVAVWKVKSRPVPRRRCRIEGMCGRIGDGGLYDHLKPSAMGLGDDLLPVKYILTTGMFLEDPCIKARVGG
jgi:hypothetical protein